MNAAAPAMGGAPTVPPAPVMSVASATGVDAHIVLAGPGARSFAFLIDWLIRSGLAMVYLVVAALLIHTALSRKASAAPAAPIAQTPQNYRTCGAASSS